MKRGDSRFNTVFAQAVQEGLDSIGPSISDAVLFYLQRAEAVRSDRSFADPEAFDDGLKKIFGYGAKVIEKRILEMLYVKLEAPRKIGGDFRFSEEVRKAQKFISSAEDPITEKPQRNHREALVKA